MGAHGGALDACGRHPQGQLSSTRIQSHSGRFGHLVVSIGRRKRINEKIRTSWAGNCRAPRTSRQDAPLSSSCLPSPSQACISGRFNNSHVQADTIKTDDGVFFTNYHPQKSRNAPSDVCPARSLMGSLRMGAEAGHGVGTLCLAY